MRAPPVLITPGTIPSTSMHPSWPCTIKLILPCTVLSRDHRQFHTTRPPFCTLCGCLVTIHPSLHTKPPWIYSIPPPFFTIIPSFVHTSPFLHPDPCHYWNIRLCCSNKPQYIMLLSRVINA